MQEQPQSEFRKLHGAAIGVWLLDTGKILQALIIPLVFGSGAAGLREGDDTGFAVGAIAYIFIGLVLANALLSPIFRYRRFRYRFDGGTLVIHGGGLFNKWRRVIPLDKVQSVDVVQKLRHKLFGVVELNVEVVGGNQTEGSLAALAPEEAERIRSILLKKKEVPPGEEQAPVDEALPFARLGVKELLVAGITGGRVAVTALLLSQLMEILPARFDIGDAVERLVSDSSADRGIDLLILFIALSVLGFFIVALAISLVVTVFTYWDFTIKHKDDRLVVTRGLLSAREAIIPLHRVQAIKMQENPIRRVLGYASLSVVVAGYSSNQNKQSQVTTMLLPIGKKADAVRIAGEVLGSDDIGDVVHLEPAPMRAISIRIFDALVLTAALTIVSKVFFQNLYGLWSALVFLPVAYGSYRALGHTVKRNHLVTRSGFLVRTTTVAPIKNIQQLEVRSSIFLRPIKLSNLVAWVPKGSAKALYMDSARASERFHALSHQFHP